MTIFAKRNKVRVSVIKEKRLYALFSFGGCCGRKKILQDDLDAESGPALGQPVIFFTGHGGTCDVDVDPRNVLRDEFGQEGGGCGCTGPPTLFAHGIEVRVNTPERLYMFFEEGHRPQRLHGSVSCSHKLRNCLDTRGRVV
jgi:hypothetical protein